MPAKINLEKFIINSWIIVGLENNFIIKPIGRVKLINKGVELRWQL